ncbi:MAG: biopolymer transporter ExbD [Elusimicrobiota bacterium]
MSNPFVRREEAALISDVNVVPLADVSLVLLIILLVLSPMAAQSMLRVQTAAAKAEAPGPKAGEDPLQPKEPEPVLAIGLTPLGYVVNGKLLAGDGELMGWLAPELKRRDDKKVFLSPELDVNNGRVVSAIETIQNSGASSVALVQVADDQAIAAQGAPR